MEASKRFQIRHNVTFRILDKFTGKLIHEHKGHNTATNTMLEGIGHYLIGEGVLRQGYSMLSDFIPRYISLGTMGLRNQDQDSSRLPIGISGHNYTGDEETDFDNYMKERPGYGSDGYSSEYNNNRPYFGLGPAFSCFSTEVSYYKGDITYYKGVAYEAKSNMIVDPDQGIHNYWNSDQWKVASSSEQPTCYELITPGFPRQEITFRDVLPEYESEHAKTINVVFSAMIPSGAINEFVDASKDYVFITEAGLWSEKDFVSKSASVNGLVAGYRVVPPNPVNWYMKASDVPDNAAISYLIEQGIVNPTDAQIASAKRTLSAQNRQILKEQVLRVERDQVVQVIWKIEIGNLDDTGGDVVLSYIPESIEDKLNEIYELIGKKVIYAENVVIASSKWTTGGPSGYPYAARINISGVDQTYFPMVQFSDTDQVSFNFCPYATSSAGAVTIYCSTRPSRTITLPIIMCSQGTKVDART